MLRRLWAQELCCNRVSYRFLYTSILPLFQHYTSSFTLSHSSLLYRYRSHVNSQSLKSDTFIFHHLPITLYNCFQSCKKIVSAELARRFIHMLILVCCYVLAKKMIRHIIQRCRNTNILRIILTVNIILMYVRAEIMRYL